MRTSEVLKADDYQIVNGGKRNELDYGSKIVILFASGSGSGDQSYYCEFRSTYKVYRHEGMKLKYSGEINEISGSSGNSFIGKIDGKEIKCDFLCADEVFTKIEKRKEMEAKKFEATTDGGPFIYSAGDILSSGVFDNEDLQEIMRLKVGEVFMIDMCGDSLKRIK